jgi:hypothetical protein
MKRIFQTILKPGQQLDENLLDQREKEFIEDFINNAHIFGFDGQNCTWKEIEEMFLITFVEKQDIDKVIELEIKTGSTPDVFTDITNDVINGKYDTSILGYAEEKMIIEFHQYKLDFIGSDEILDKINEVGIESLTENDKRILRGEEMRSPLLDHFNISDSE